MPAVLTHTSICTHQGCPPAAYSRPPRPLVPTAVERPADPLKHATTRHTSPSTPHLTPDSHAQACRRCTRRLWMGVMCGGGGHASQAVTRTSVKERRHAGRQQQPGGCHLHAAMTGRRTKQRRHPKRGIVFQPPQHSSTTRVACPSTTSPTVYLAIGFSRVDWVSGVTAWCAALG